MLLATLFGLPPPLTAVQLLWLNLVTNGMQVVALGLEKGEPGLLDHPPRRPRADLRPPHDRAGRHRRRGDRWNRLRLLLCRFVVRRCAGNRARGRSMANGLVPERALPEQPVGNALAVP